MYSLPETNRVLLQYLLTFLRTFPLAHSLLSLLSPHLGQEKDPQGEMAETLKCMIENFDRVFLIETEPNLRLKISEDFPYPEVIAGTPQRLVEHLANPFEQSPHFVPLLSWTHSYLCKDPAESSLLFLDLITQT